MPNLVAAAVAAADGAARLPVLEAPVDDHTLTGLVKPPGQQRLTYLQLDFLYWYSIVLYEVKHT